MSIRKRTPTITNRIRVLRAEQRLTQEVLAGRARLPQSRVSKIENGHVAPTKTEQRRLARGLRVTVPDVFPEAVAS